MSYYLIIFRSAILLFIFCVFSYSSVLGQHSVARIWNEQLLEAIRNDFARPTVHARNLFHISAAMYDAWAVYDDNAKPYFLNNQRGNYYFSFSGIQKPTDIEAARKEAISYAAFRLLKHRFKKSPEAEFLSGQFEKTLTNLGYDPGYTDVNYSNGSPAALGNYIAKCVIEYGHLDGANELNSYQNKHYKTVNPPLSPNLPGNPDMSHPSRWQPLAFDVFIDQSGHVTSGNVPDFLGPEWGKVLPFALEKENLRVMNRDGEKYYVYHDPGAPPLLNEVSSDDYKWGFLLVAIWASHLSPADSIIWDISPNAMGNIQNLPKSMDEYSDFYDLINGGDPGLGYENNPITGQPYEPQLVPRGDYTRVLAEFWADGPHSETPPGHWFTILNYVSDHPDLIKKIQGQGELTNDLEWDVKAYFTLGGAVHDAAVTAWGIKGWYDYTRPVSAIRYMAEMGQSSDPKLPNYSESGIPLVPDYVELVQEGDPLAGINNEYINKIKLYTWRGPGYIDDPSKDMSGVGWILAENWWPYQRPTFVTPPFAGYISGHSTFSRTAAEVLTLFTGSEFFPGGMGEFIAEKNEFLVFEEGPSVDVKLQWATYRDASDQTSLSRIWGGIHPPADDIPGRLIGEKIGVEAFHYARSFFEGKVNPVPAEDKIFKLFPNPVVKNNNINIAFYDQSSFPLRISIFDINGRVLLDNHIHSPENFFSCPSDHLSSGIYLLRLSGNNLQVTKKIQIVD